VLDEIVAVLRRPVAVPRRAAVVKGPTAALTGDAAPLGRPAADNTAVTVVREPRVAGGGPAVRGSVARTTRAVRMQGKHAALTSVVLGILSAVMTSASKGAVWGGTRCVAMEAGAARQVRGAVVTTAALPASQDTKTLCCLLGSILRCSRVRNDKFTSEEICPKYVVPGKIEWILYNNIIV